MASSGLRRRLFQICVAAPVAVTIHDLLCTVRQVPDDAMQPVLNPQLRTVPEVQPSLWSHWCTLGSLMGGGAWKDWVLVDKYSARHQLIAVGDVVTYR